MNIEEDPILQRMFIKKNLSDSRRRMYKNNFKTMHELTGLTPSELIVEAKKEQKPSLDENSQIIFKDVEERKVTDYLYKYHEHMVEKKLKPSTIKTNMGVVRSFYNSCKIELPDNIKIIIPLQLIREGDIPCLEDIKKGFEQAKYLKYKAIILLAATSGIRSGDLRHFTVGDFLEATKEYHNGTLDDLLHSKKDIIPTWEFIPRKTRNTGNICITFNTPEASKYIIDYLKQRIEKGHKLTKNSFLFVSGKEKQYSIKGFLWVFSSVNNELFGKDKLNRDFFRAHNLRKFFLSTFRQKTNDLFTLKIVAGHTLAKNNDINYQQIPIDEIKRQYMKVIPFISIKDTRVYTIKSKEFTKLEKQLTEKDERITKLEEKAKKSEKESKINKEMLELLTDPEVLKYLKKLKKSSG